MAWTTHGSLFKSREPITSTATNQRHKTASPLMHAVSFVQNLKFCQSSVAFNSSWFYVHKWNAGGFQSCNIPCFPNPTQLENAVKGLGIVSGLELFCLTFWVFAQQNGQRAPTFLTARGNQVYRAKAMFIATFVNTKAAVQETRRDRLKRTS